MREEKSGGTVLTPWGESLRLVRCLGSGAFSRVYLVREEGAGAWFACKVSGAAQLLEREGELMARIRHPLFPGFCGQWQRDGKGFLLMEYVCGCSLETLLRRRGAFPEAQVRRVGIELAEGLKILHELPEPVIFRDVKPQNILLRQDGRVKLLDLGAACRMRQRDSMAGTPGYAAPEQLLPGAPLTPASDVYGVGRTLQAMAGSDCGRKLKNLLAHCTRTEPGRRFPDMPSLRDALAQKKEISRSVCLENLWETNYKRDYDVRVEK